MTYQSEAFFGELKNKIQNTKLYRKAWQFAHPYHKRAASIAIKGLKGTGRTSQATTHKKRAGIYHDTDTGKHQIGVTHHILHHKGLSDTARTSYQHHMESHGYHALRNRSANVDRYFHPGTKTKVHVFHHGTHTEIRTMTPKREEKVKDHRLNTASGPTFRRTSYDRKDRIEPTFTHKPGSYFEHHTKKAEHPAVPAPKKAEAPAPVHAPKPEPKKEAPKKAAPAKKEKTLHERLSGMPKHGIKSTKDKLGNVSHHHVFVNKSSAKHELAAGKIHNHLLNSGYTPVSRGKYSNDEGKGEHRVYRNAHGHEVFVSRLDRTKRGEAHHLRVTYRK